MTDHLDPAVRAAILRDQQRRMAQPADPAVREAVRRAEQRELDVDRRAAQAEHERQRAARAELDARKDREREVFMAAGGDPTDFDRTWSERVHEIMVEKLRARDRQQQASSVWR